MGGRRLDRGAGGGAGRRRCPPPHTGPSCLSQPPLCVFTVPKAHPPKYLECKECFGILKNISQPSSSCNPAGPSQGPFSFPEEAKGLAGSEDTCGCHSEEGVWLGRERTWWGDATSHTQDGPGPHIPGSAVQTHRGAARRKASSVFGQETAAHPLSVTQQITPMATCLSSVCSP